MRVLAATAYANGAPASFLLLTIGGALLRADGFKATVATRGAESSPKNSTGRDPGTVL